MRLLRYLFTVSWAGIVGAIVAGLLCGAANAYLVTLINSSVGPQPRPGAPQQFIVTGLIVLVGGLVSQVILMRLAQNAVYRFRAGLSERIVAAPLQHLERLGLHRLIATLTEDVRSLSQAATAIPMMCIDAATIVGCLVYLAIVSGVVFTITVGSTLITIACVETILSRVRRLFRSARENEDALLHAFTAVGSGIKELKLHRGRRADFMDRHLLGTARKLRDQNVDAGSQFAFAQGFGQLFQLATMAFILFGLALIIHMPRETMVGYVLITTFLAMPMQNIMHRIPDLLRGDVALAKIRSLSLSMEVAHDESDLPYDDRPVMSPARIELVGVGYTYPPEGPGMPGAPGAPGMPPPPPPGPDGAGTPGPHPLGGDGEHPDVNGVDFGPGRRPAPRRRGRGRHQPPTGHPLPPHPPFPPDGGQGFHLGPVDLAFEPGHVTFIVGGNGSGKSTLAKLITGLYAPDAGSVRLNGEEIGRHNVEWFRQHTAAVFTDFHLFEDYLGMDRPGIDDEVRTLLDHLQLSHKVTVSDGRLSTIALSQGQRKRLALLTALLEDRPVYLFDEWAADQDPHFRDLFYGSILSDLRARGKTVIVITHDDRYFDRADRLIKLDLGRVVEGVATV
ncbi:ATP-binding cassette domain-containing protein [Tsukamurella sp. 8F]|uniref:ATP-binding cassette domain-containing protein n=1 Tax=unclassified Tsukamurella TaxID=2633480 RepID=UPI0023B976CD|nr:MULTISPECIES: ATP-binding cassette domain-containing protein [unclassified Tsukamurella]MDF0529090.1 ATP-binding cassette domain-containing protein [Tsukamurella sp. 8J]MDF0589013.1 ATP-binding cassette domain-containing protein [Tsukamurella sp. 8F]